MAKYIEKEVAVALLRKESKRLINDTPNLIDPKDRVENVCVTVGVDIAKDIIKSIPAADVDPVKHGEWKWSHGGECSVCGFRNSNFDFNYCPNCGAKMGE